MSNSPVKEANTPAETGSIDERLCALESALEDIDCTLTNIADSVNEIGKMLSHICSRM